MLFRIKFFYFLLFSILSIIPLLLLIFLPNESTILLLAKYEYVIKNFINENFFFSYSLFFLFVFFSNLLNIPGGSVKAIIAGYFFGLELSILNLLLSITLSSFFIVKFNKMVIGKVDFKKFKTYKEKFSNFNNNWFSPILIRLMPVFPFYIQNILLSSIKISNFRFIITTLIGIFPYVFIYSYLGSQLLNISFINKLRYLGLNQFPLTTLLVIIFTFIFLSIMIVLFTMKFYKKKMIK